MELLHTSVKFHTKGLIAILKGKYYISNICGTRRSSDSLKHKVDLKGNSQRYIQETETQHERIS